MKVSIAFATLLFFIHFQWFNATFRRAEFQFRAFHHLNVTGLVDLFVDDFMDCSFACLQNVLCVSFNVAVSADDKGKLRCELLPSTSSNNTANLAADPQFYFYEIKNPCHSKPCYNSGTCFPISFRDGTYKCTCHPGFLGRLCETAPPECVRYTVLNQTTRRYTYGIGPGQSDHTLSQEWYRFQANKYTRMIGRCILNHRCGGHFTGWLKGGHPSVADGIVGRTVCFHGWPNGCCHTQRAILVRDCGGYYVYELKASHYRTYVYCTT